MASYFTTVEVDHRHAGIFSGSLRPSWRHWGFEPRHQFHDYALFPKMTVRDTIAFGLRVRGVPHGDRSPRPAGANEPEYFL